MDVKPWLLVDIDGVLNVLCSNREAEERGLVSKRFTLDDLASSFRLRLDLSHGPMLSAMTEHFDLAWCTAWQQDAHQVGRALHLPHMPVVEFDLVGEHTKVHGIERFVGDRPFVWLDDDVWPSDRRLLDALTVPHLLVEVTPHVGLTEDHLNQAREWATTKESA